MSKMIWVRTGGGFNSGVWIRKKHIILVEPIQTQNGVVEGRCRLTLSVKYGESNLVIAREDDDMILARLDPEEADET